MLFRIKKENGMKRNPENPEEAGNMLFKVNLEQYSDKP